MEISEAVLEAGKRLGYNSLKEEQIECITKFMFGHDVFCILPTGFGKTACFACLPMAFDLHLQKADDEKSIVVVISPLTALMKDQVQLLITQGSFETSDRLIVRIEVD
jgi:ATP-dependent DNA helicase RecQ